MRILVVRLSSLGDVVHAMPAVAGLRRANPDARIDWLVDERYRELVDLVSAIDNTIPVTRSVTSGLQLMRGLRETRYDIAVDFQGLMKSALFARFSGARRVLGFSSDQLREPAAAWFHSEHVDVAREEHVIGRNLALVGGLGAAARPWDFPFNVRSEAGGSNGQQVVEDAERRFALLNPGAAWQTKRWHPSGFGHLARRLSAEHGLRSIVLWGPGERDLAESVVESSDGAAETAPPTSIADVVALARAAVVMVAGDTGPLHIAAAVGTPVVGVYGPSDPTRNGPWSPVDEIVTRFDECDCRRSRPNSRGVVVRQCTQPRPCMTTIGVDDVARAVSRRLGSAAGG